MITMQDGITLYVTRETGTATAVIPEYDVAYETRQRGAIGIFQLRVFRVKANTESEARQAGFDAAQAAGWETRNPGPVKKVQV